MRRAVAAFTVFASLALPAISSAGDGASYLGESVQALQSGKVYISPLATQIDPSAEQHLQQKIGGSDIAVAVLPPDAAKETGGNVHAFVTKIAGGTNHKTVVVVIGKDFDAGSAILPTGLAGKYANQAEHSSSVESGLNQFISEVKAYQAQPAPSPSHGSGGSPILLLVVAIVAGLTALLGTGLYKRQHALRTPDPDHVELNRSPDAVKDRLKQLLALRESVTDTELRSAITDICRDSEEYFSGAQQRGASLTSEATSFVGYLQNVEEVLQKYLEIQAKPRYFPNASADMERGKQSVMDFADFVLKSAQQATTRGMTEFNVNMDIISAQKHRFVTE